MRERVGGGVRGAGASCIVFCGWAGVDAHLGEAERMRAMPTGVKLIRQGAGRSFYRVVEWDGGKDGVGD